MMGGRQRIVADGRGTPVGQRRRIRRAIVVAAVLLSLSLLLALFVARWISIRTLRSQIAALREAQRVAISQQEDLQARWAERDDPDAIETEARRRLGLVRPGEEKVIFVPEE